MKVIGKYNLFKCKILKTGEHIHTGWEGYIREKYIKTENLRFELTLKPDKQSRGQSSTVFLYTDDQEKPWLMTVSGMMEFMKQIANGQVLINDGWLTGHFTIRKQGQTYTLWSLAK